VVRFCVVAAAFVSALLCPTSTYGLQRPAGPTDARLIGSPDIGISRRDGVVSDWRRYLALTPSERRRRMTVFDTKTGRRYGLDGCEPLSGRNGHFLLYCGAATQEPSYQLLNARTRAIHSLPAVQKGERFSRIGRYWVAGEGPCSGDHCYAAAVFINWRTGERRLCDTFPDKAICDSDLDGRRLRRTHVTPGERAPGLRLIRRRRALDLKTATGTVRLTSKCSTLLYTCYGSIFEHRASWSESRDGHGRIAVAGGYDPRTKRLARWRMHAIGPGPYYWGTAKLRVFHTAFGVAMQVAAQTDKTGAQVTRYAIFFAPWPRGNASRR
jgi:hypothetical protein